MVEIEQVTTKGEVGERNKRQNIQIDYTRKNAEWMSPEFPKILRAFKYPLHFIDFETTAIAVPYHAGSLHGPEPHHGLGVTVVLINEQKDAQDRDLNEEHSWFQTELVVKPGPGCVLVGRPLKREAVTPQPSWLVREGLRPPRQSGKLP